MSSEEDRVKRARRLQRNQAAKELRKRQYQQRIIQNKKKKDYDDADRD